MRKTLDRSVCISTVLLSLAPLSSCGKPTKSQSIRISPASLTSFDGNVDNGVLDYQIGPTWDKTPVASSLTANGSSVLQKTANATAKVTVMYSTGTGFVVGEKDGNVLVATNHHVIEDQDFCDETKVAFELLGIKKLRCDQVIATDTELDLTLFTLKGLDSAGTAKLLAAALPVSKIEPRKGQDLVTIGYGFAGNPDSKLMVDQGSDCKVYSKDGEVRFMADPDTVNPGPYKTWVFATGCDVSHGDSGSALVDRKTGEVVGILSTGKIPKTANIRSAAHLGEIYEGNNEEIWSELTYVVPFSKIFEKLGDILK